MKPIGIGHLEKAKRKTPFSVPPPIKESKGTNVRLHRSTKKEMHDQEGQLSVDVYQTDDEIVIIAPIAGTASEDLHISITDDVITIKGRREMLNHDEIQKESFYLQECFWGNFSRSIILPASVDTRGVEARFKNNVLTIRVPKIERIKTRLIQIHEE